MTPDETVERLRKQMYAARLNDAVPDMVTALRAIMNGVGNDHAFCLAMAITLGMEIASNEGIADRERDNQMASMIEIAQGVYQIIRQGEQEDGI
jgi:hypothetical protein